MENKIAVCRGPMCTIGGSELLTFLKNHPAHSMIFDAAECDCVGNCSNAPVVFINGDELKEATIEMLEEEIGNL